MRREANITKNKESFVKGQRSFILLLFGMFFTFMSLGFGTHQAFLTDSCIIQSIMLNDTKKLSGCVLDIDYQYFLLGLGFIGLFLITASAAMQFWQKEIINDK